MLDQYLSSSGSFEFPSFTVAIFTILLAMILSTVIALTYKFTFQEDYFPNKFFQAIVLSSTVSAMVMMAVGDNLAIGFGVLGAVSIIRFRTLIRSPRNIIFIFMSLSIGIATGVFGYSIAISGTVLFCVAVVLLYYSPYGKMGDYKAELVVSVANSNVLKQLEDLLKNEDVNASIVRMRSLEEGLTRYSLYIGLKQEQDRDKLYRQVIGIEGITDVRFDSRDTDEQL